MSDQRYAPPNARVEPRALPDDAHTRPGAVWVVCGFLWLEAAGGPVHLAIALWQGGTPVSPWLGSHLRANAFGLAYSMAISGLSLLASLALFRMSSQSVNLLALMLAVALGGETWLLVRGATSTDSAALNLIVPVSLTVFALSLKRKGLLR